MPENEPFGLLRLSTEIGFVREDGFEGIGESLEEQNIHIGAASALTRTGR